jgi:hypothetical protein
MPSTKKIAMRLVPSVMAVVIAAGCTSPEGRYEPGEKPTSPPPMRAPNIERPPKPSPDHTWIDGYWQWSESSQEWQWVRGRWAR